MIRAPWLSSGAALMIVYDPGGAAAAQDVAPAAIAGSASTVRRADPRPQSRLLPERQVAGPG